MRKAKTKKKKVSKRKSKYHITLAVGGAFDDILKASVKPSKK